MSLNSKTEKEIWYRHRKSVVVVVFFCIGNGSFSRAYDTGVSHDLDPRVNSTSSRQTVGRKLETVDHTRQETQVQLFNPFQVELTKWF